MDSIAQRVHSINEPQTIAMSKLARELMATGVDVVNLSLGEPDFETPAHIKQAAKDAIDNNFTYYTPVAGNPDLRQAISAKFLRDSDLHYTPDQIVVTTGAKQAIMNTIMAIIDPLDEVIIPTPYWVSYSEMVKLMGGVPVFVSGILANNYKITAEQLEAVITSKSKAFLFSSPCNPTGSVYSYSELELLVKVFEKHPQIFIISDEIYEYINFVGKHVSIGSFASIRDRVITINGLSKGFAMTGWRLGYLGAPKLIAQACEKIQGQFTSGTSSISQKAAVAALTGDLTPSYAMVDAFKRRRKLFHEGLETIPGLICNNPDGAFYFFPNISAYLGKSFEGKKMNTATDLCLYLLNHAHVSVVTGEAFGEPNCIRISYAASEEKLTKAIGRIKNALGELII
ncbi:MAG: pyridoxal phosphate-dependent aminotransferase [Bacteroidia bacterium]|nr:pyridoxal phosphate-dependent aminotransferase [Bacteroidia bacterium]